MGGTGLWPKSVAPRPVVAAQRDWIFYHGTPDERSWEHGSAYGIHVGTEQAAHDALNARIGKPLEGRWDGTREYGKTLLDPGQFTGSERGGEVRYPAGRATYSTGDKVPMDARPSVFPVRITGPMIGHPAAPVEDDYANSRMHGQITRGNARSGYFYRNVGEDEGSISAAVPSAAHLERVHPPREAARWQPDSGIFAPTTGLDQRLFEGGSLRPGVRRAVMEKLDRCLRVDSGLAGSDWQEWLHVWIAGGSASEWAGSRPNDAARDLDVLVGLDLAEAQGNSSFEGMDSEQAATALNAAFRHCFNEAGWRPEFGGTWSLTAYCNPHVTNDITAIRPYAAWDLTDSRWVVRPPHLPGHSIADFDPAAVQQARAVAAEARAILRMREPARTPQARALWNRLHEGRSRAFSAEGQGWEDPSNLVEKWLAYSPHGVLRKIRELALAAADPSDADPAEDPAADPTAGEAHAVLALPEPFRQQEARRILTEAAGLPEGLEEALRRAAASPAGRMALGHGVTAALEEALPNPYHGDARFPGRRPRWGDRWFHGTQLASPELASGRPEEQPHGNEDGTLWGMPNRMLGTHFTPLHRVARQFAIPQRGPSAVVHARLNLRDPRRFADEREMNIDIARWAHGHFPGWHDPAANEAVRREEGDEEGTRHQWGTTGKDDESYRAETLMRWHPRLPEIVRGYTDHLHAQGHHGIIYGNEQEGPGAPNGHVLHWSAIATHPDQIETARVEHIAPEGRRPQSHETSWEGAGAGDEADEMWHSVGVHHQGGDYWPVKSGQVRMPVTAAREEAAPNPPCHYCGEPLDDEDVDSGMSAHEECDQDHWCEAHQEHHDEDGLAEQHNDTYTDWSEHLPFEHGIHRGIPLVLPAHVHEVVHDPSQPVARRAEVLRSHLAENPSRGGGWQGGDEGGLGVHWTDREDAARSWGSDDYTTGPVGTGPKPTVTHVVLHAASPAEEHIETDPDELERRHMWGFGHQRSEREVPLRAGAPVHLTGVSWKPGGHDQWTRHDFDRPTSHLAAREDAWEDDDQDTDRYVTCDQGHDHWGAAGAAGLLIRHRGDDGQHRYLLQHRSPYVQHGGTWSTPGGALQHGEEPEEGARREAEEEFGQLPSGLRHHHTFSDDHGGWAYHTVVMDSPHQFSPHGGGDGDWETQGHGWFTPEEMKGLQLHPGFAASWAKVRKSGAATSNGTSFPLEREAALPTHVGAIPPREVREYEGTVGDPSHITRSEEGLMPTSAVAGLPGNRGEIPGEHRNRQGGAWEDFKRDIAANGIRNPIFITVDHGQEPRINEGNHRRDAAVELGLDHVPVEVRYFGHAEREGLVQDRGGMRREAAYDPDSRIVRNTGELGWGDEEWAAARREPWHAAAKLAQHQTRFDHPKLSMQFPRSHEGGDEMVGRILGHAGYRGDVSGAFVSRHPDPSRRTSNPAWLDGAPGVTLHPERWDYGTVAHEAAHHAVMYDHAAAPNEDQPDEQVHGPEWAGHYASALNRISRNAGDEFLEHHRFYRGMIDEGLQWKRPSDLDAADLRWREAGAPQNEAQWRQPGAPIIREGAAEAPLSFTYAPVTGTGNHSIVVHPGGAAKTKENRVGRLSWTDEDAGPRIVNLWVHPDIQRRGVATEMYRRAREIAPGLRHSDNPTDDGRDWITGMERKTAAKFAWYHGTASEYQPGDLVDPSYAGKVQRTARPGSAYFTHSLGQATDFADWAQKASRTADGEYPAAHVYEVEPTGDYEEDPDDSRSAWVTRSPLRVVRHVMSKELGDHWPKTAATGYEGLTDRSGMSDEDLNDHLIDRHHIRPDQVADPRQRHRVDHEKYVWPHEHGPDGEVTHDQGGVSTDAFSSGWHEGPIDPVFGVAHVAVTGYEGLTKRSGMIYLDIPDGKVRHLPGGVDDHHITLVYLGKDVGDDEFAEAVRRTREAAGAHPPMEGSIGGLGSFPPSDSSDGKTPVFVPVDVPGIRKLRESLEDLSASEFKKFVPHVTLAYLDEDEAMPAPHPTVPVSFGRLHVKRGDEVVSFPFGGSMPSKTAAWDRSGSEKHGVYLRFGDWPHDEKSYSPAGGYKEEGVSVYDLDDRGEPSIDHGLDRGHVHDDECSPDEFGTCEYSDDPWHNPDNDPKGEMQGRVARAERNRYYGDDRPGDTGHLVKGDVSGVGYDGEPLLKNVRRVGDWIDHRHQFVYSAAPHRLARDESAEDYEPPEEKPGVHRP